MVDLSVFLFFFNYTATTVIYTLSLHDALPIFLHMTNVVQMKARRTPDGFVAYGQQRDKLNQAYNGFKQVDDSGASVLGGVGEKSDLAMTSSPGASSGFRVDRAFEKP